MSEATEKLLYKAQANRTSQRGRVLCYLNSLEKTEKNYKIYKAIELLYLVEALESEGIREREDIKKIGYRCAEELEAQAKAIKWSLGIESSKTEERPYYFSQPQQFQPMAAPIVEESEPEPESEEEEEDEYDYENDPDSVDLSKFKMSKEERKELLEGFMNSL